MNKSPIARALLIRASKRKLSKPPRWTTPKPVEVYYRKMLLAYVNKLRELAQKLIIPHLPRLLGSAGTIKMDSWSADLDTLMQEFQDQGDDIFPTHSQLTMLANIATRTNDFNKEQWYKICKAVLGVDIYSHEPQLIARMEAFVHDNATLIKDCTQDVYSGVRLVVSNGILQGQRASSIADDLMSDTDLTRGVFAKVETRAAFIARDQVSKLNGDIASMRQQNAGVDEYYWRSVEDERVVGTPGGRFPNPSIGHGDHYKMDGTLCKWGNNNVYSIDDGKAWIKRPENMRGAIPGSQYNCRCYADPVFGTLFK